MNKDERSLLLYLETRLVDHNGIIDARNMNEEDFRIAEKWDREGFIDFGRLKMDEIKRIEKNSRGQARSHYVRFSTKAWEAAHRERRARSDRMIPRWEKQFFKPQGLVESSLTNSPSGG